MFSKHDRSPAMKYFLFLCFSALALPTVFAQSGRQPVIIIPGLAGSELVNRETNKVVWFRITRSRADDLRLPLSADLPAMRDSLDARGAIRGIKIGLREIEVYGSLINFLKRRGYAETSWESPKASGAVYVFAYDWRRDNVENARLLIRKIEDVKRRLNKPDLKFNIVAHSMGGLIARYAAMYGDADLKSGDAKRPTWAGAVHFDKIFLLGTPNAGSLLALNSLVNGITPFGININLPFVQNLSRFDAFTIPSLYQLLPNEKSFRAFDENLQPVAVDIYDAKTWDRYGWNPIADKKFAAQFGADDRRDARAYFLSALKRARDFNEALDAESSTGQAVPVSFYLIGGDCADTLDAIVIRKAGGGFAADFKATAFRSENGKQISAAELKKLMFAKGDGIVAKRSLTDDNQFSFQSSFQCEKHNDLVTNQAIQNGLLKLIEQN